MSKKPSTFCTFASECSGHGAVDTSLWRSCGRRPVLRGNPAWPSTEKSGKERSNLGSGLRWVKGCSTEAVSPCTRKERQRHHRSTMFIVHAFLLVIALTTVALRDHIGPNPQVWNALRASALLQGCSLPAARTHRVALAGILNLELRGFPRIPRNKAVFSTRASKICAGFAGCGSPASASCNSLQRIRRLWNDGQPFKAAA